MSGVWWVWGELQLPQSRMKGFGSRLARRPFIHFGLCGCRVTSLSEGATTEWVDNPLNCRLPLGVHLRRIAVRTALYERLLASSTEQSQALYESRPMPQFQGSYAGTAGAGQERYCELCDQRLSSQEALEEHVQGLEHHRAERLRDLVAQECPQLLTSGEGRTLWDARLQLNLVQKE